MLLSSSPNSAPVASATGAAVSANVSKPVETSAPRPVQTGVVLSLSPAAEASIAGSSGPAAVVDPSSNLLLPARFGENMKGVELVGVAADAMKPGVFQVYENPALREAQQSRQAAQEQAQAEGRAAAMESGAVGELSPEQRAILNEMQSRDAEVRAHEMAHMAAAGGHAGGVSYSYQTGPDGKQYAIGGSVQIDTTPEATPDRTIAKAQRIRAAALAPADPSAADRAVAASASRMELAARLEAEQQAAREAGAARAEHSSAGSSSQSAAASGGKSLASFAGGSGAVAQLYAPNERALAEVYVSLAS